MESKRSLAPDPKGIDWMIVCPPRCFERASGVLNLYGSQGVMSRDMFPEALEHLGFLIRSPHMASALSEYTMNDEFIDDPMWMRGVNFCGKTFFDHVQQIFKQADRTSCHQVTQEDAFDMLRLVGLRLTQVEVTSLLAQAGVAPGELVDLEQFYEVLRQRLKEKENLSELTLQIAKDSFFVRAATYFGPAGEKLRRIPVSGLAGSLQEVFGSSLSKQLQSLTCRAASDAEIAFEEFLEWVKRAKLNVKDMLMELFHERDTDGNGMVDIEETIDMLQSIGLTPLRCEVLQLMADVEGTPIEEVRDMSFDDFAKFIEVFHSGSGFGSQKVRQLKVAFDLTLAGSSCNQGAGCLDAHNIIRMARHMGYHPETEELFACMQEHGTSIGGKYDLRRSCRLLRLYREALLRGILTEFVKLTGRREGKLPRGQVGSVLAEAGLIPEKVRGVVALAKARTVRFPTKLTAGERAASKSEALDFEALVGLLDTYLDAQGPVLQHQAGFTSEEVALLRGVFEPRAKGICGADVKHSLSWLLLRFGIPMRSKQDRRLALELQAQAWKTAQIAGYGGRELGEPDGGFITFWVFVHLLRVIADHFEGERLSRELQAMAETDFSFGEIKEFRLLFKTHQEREHVGHMDPVERLLYHCFVDKYLSTEGFAEIIRPLRLNAETYSNLKQRIREEAAICQEPQSPGRADSVMGSMVDLDDDMHLFDPPRKQGFDDGLLDFASMLRLMRWLVDLGALEDAEASAWRPGQQKQGDLSRQTSPGTESEGQ